MFTGCCCPDPGRNFRPHQRQPVPDTPDCCRNSGLLVWLSTRPAAYFLGYSGGRHLDAVAEWRGLPVRGTIQILQRVVVMLIAQIPGLKLEHVERMSALSRRVTRQPQDDGVERAARFVIERQCVRAGHDIDTTLALISPETSSDGPALFVWHEFLAVQRVVRPGSPVGTVFPASTEYDWSAPVRFRGDSGFEIIVTRFRPGTRLRLGTRLQLGTRFHASEFSRSKNAVRRVDDRLSFPAPRSLRWCFVWPRCVASWLR